MLHPATTRDPRTIQILAPPNQSERYQCGTDGDSSVESVGSAFRGRPVWRAANGDDAQVGRVRGSAAGLSLFIARQQAVPHSSSGLSIEG
jgi:hypothetical protein